MILKFHKRGCKYLAKNEAAEKFSYSDIAYLSTRGIIREFDIMLGIGTSHRLCRKTRPTAAPISVAMLPKIISRGAPPPKRLARTHPMNSPGTAASVNSGSIVSASEILT